MGNNNSGFQQKIEKASGRIFDRFWIDTSFVGACVCVCVCVCECMSVSVSVCEFEFECV